MVLGDLFDPHGFPSMGFIVSEASHHRIASIARSDRLLLAKQQVCICTEYMLLLNLKTKAYNIYTSNRFFKQHSCRNEPGYISDRPQVKAEDVLPDIQDCSCEADERDDPGECRHHVKSPFLHISANRGSRRRKCLMTSSGLTHSR